MNLFDIIIARKLSGGGGGGGVNLQTATLTMVGGNDTTVINLSPHLDESTGYLENKYAPLTGSYTIPLFKAEGGGGTYSTDIWANGEQISVSTSGDITIEEEQDPETGEYTYFATITGDCTITIN